MKHIALYLTNASNKDVLIEKICTDNLLYAYADLSGLKGELFSLSAINRLINEECIHEQYKVTTAENISLQSMSSGQQRRALMDYILNRKPQYIILDDLFGSIDLETQTQILAKLNDIESSTLLIQLLYRKQDLLPCIHTVLPVDNDNQLNEAIDTATFMADEHTSKPLVDFTLPHLFLTPSQQINPLVKLTNVSAAYGNKQVLKNINWTIEIADFWQLTGPVGVGKSTLLSMIIGDNPLGYGQDMILFGKKKGTGETIWDIKKQIGYFTPTMTMRFTRNDTVEHMIISGLNDSVGLYVKPTGVQQKIADAWMQVLGELFRHKRYHNLSFGQQRMLFVVRAMVKQPPLLILDEPTVGLDDYNTQLFLDLIHAIVAQRKVAVVFVSHRSEPSLNPDKIFQLIPSENGSIGAELSYYSGIHLQRK